MKLTPEVITLHRYFIWADRMKTHFDGVLEEINQTPVNEKVSKKIEGVDTFLYMSLWYGMLYVLIEGWKELKLQDEKIDQLLTSKNVGLLRRYRNGVFHFQKEYYDKHYMNLMVEGEDVANWTRNLRDEFSRLFLDVYRGVLKKNA